MLASVGAVLGQVEVIRCASLLPVSLVSLNVCRSGLLLLSAGFLKASTLDAMGYRMVQAL